MSVYRSKYNINNYNNDDDNDDDDYYYYYYYDYYKLVVLSVYLISHAEESGGIHNLLLSLIIDFN